MVGTPLRRSAGEYPQHRDVLAHRGRNSGADPHHGADRRNEADADQRADDAAAEVAEYVLAGDDRNVDLTRQLSDRRAVKKQRVQRHVQNDDDRRADQQGARHAALWIVHFAHDIGRGIPARIRIHHEDEADREGCADHMGRIGRGRYERDRLRCRECKSCDQQRENESHLQQRSRPSEICRCGECRAVPRALRSIRHRGRARAAVRSEGSPSRIGRTPWRQAPPAQKTRP